MKGILLSSPVQLVIKKLMLVTNVVVFYRRSKTWKSNTTGFSPEVCLKKKPIMDQWFDNSNLID
jgi:hypothetical protein